MGPEKQVKFIHTGAIDENRDGSPMDRTFVIHDEDMLLPETPYSYVIPLDMDLSADLKPFCPFIIPGSLNRVFIQLWHHRNGFLCFD